MSREAMQMALDALEESVALNINYKSVEETNGYEFTEASTVIKMGEVAITSIKVALDRKDHELPAFWWNGLRDDERDGCQASFSESENTWHDIPMYAGFNPSRCILTLAQPEKIECSRSHPHENMGSHCQLRTEIARLTNENARLKAQPDPEPVAWIDRDDPCTVVHNKISVKRLEELGSTMLPLYTAYPQSKPHGYLQLKNAKFYYELEGVIDHKNYLQLYTTPPQRKPLSDEEMIEIMESCTYDGGKVSWNLFGRAIEAAHGIG